MQQTLDILGSVVEIIVFGMSAAALFWVASVL